MTRSDAGVRSIQLRTMLQMEPDPTTTSVSQCAPVMMRGIEKTNIERRGLVPRCLLLGNAMFHGASHAHACDAVVLGKLFTEVLVGGMHVLVDIHFRFDFRKLLRKVDGIGAIDDGANELFGFVGRDERLPAARAFRLG